MDSRSGLPQQIGPYQVVRELGRGGMGVVYVARHSALGREVALKVLLGDADPTSVERLRREAQVAAQIEHQNIVPVRDIGQHGALTYVVMDLIQGESLDGRIKRQGPLEERQAAQITLSLAAALHEAHRRGVLHRDLKPHNVLIRASDEQPLLTDFGLAKVSNQQLTQTGQMLGTPAYMPPEQVDGLATDASSDVYGLGATLYHLLTGEAPFTGTTGINIISKVLTQQPQPPSQHVPGIDPSLEEICLRCLEKDPRLRYASMAELAEALGEYLAASDAPAASGSMLVPALLVGVGSLALGGAITVLAISQVGPTAETAKTEAEPPAARTGAVPTRTEPPKTGPAPVREKTQDPGPARQERTWRLSKGRRPPARASHQMVWDAARRELLVFGGYDDAGKRSLGFWRKRSGGKWEQLPLPGGTVTPRPQSGFAMAYDEARQRVVLLTTSWLHSQTWTWDGQGWHLHPFPRGRRPPPTGSAAMAYDRERRQVVLFGGRQRNKPRGINEYHSGTWLWDGARWHPRLSENEPAPRRGHGMAYDPLRAEVVLFGGWHGKGPAFNDTWAWDGSGWKRRIPNRSPPGRFVRRQLVWHPGLKGVVLVGGKSGEHVFGPNDPKPTAAQINAMLLNDMWRWDGEEWRELEPINRPSPTFGASLIYHPVRRRLILYGGEVFAPRRRSINTWWEFY